MTRNSSPPRRNPSTIPPPPTSDRTPPLTCYSTGLNDPTAPHGFYCGLPDGHAGPHSYTIPRDAKTSLRAPRVPRLSSSPPPRNSSAPPPAARPSSIPPSRDAPTPSTLLKYTLTPGEVKILRHFHEQLQMFEDKGAIMANMLSVLMALDRGIGELEHFTELTANRVLLETMRASAPGQGAAGGQA